MAKFLRYVFFRLYKQQKKVVRDPFEATISALIFMSITPMSLAMFLDIIGAEYFWSGSLYQILGRWVSGALAFGLVFASQYYIFVKRIGLSSIEMEFGGSSKHAIAGGLAVAAYLILPSFVAVFVASELAGA